MTHPTKPSRKAKKTMRIQPFLSKDIHNRIHDYAHRRGVPLQQVVELALSEFLERTNEADLVLRRFDRVDREIGGVQRNLAALADAFGCYVQSWFGYAPPLTPEQAKDARARGGLRYGEYLKRVATTIDGQGRFFQVVIKEPQVGDARALASIATAHQEASA